MKRLHAMAALAACLLFALANPAEARHPHKPLRHDSAVASQCVLTNSGRQICRGPIKRILSRRIADANGNEGVRLIPHPAGCPYRLFCACGLAHYWGLGKGLNAVATWPKVFPRAHGPAVGLAAIRGDRHHIKGIVGGSPGAWRVVDFNSGGHLSRTYITADFRGYFFVDPRSRTASR
jgi:hypothetical protein